MDYFLRPKPAYYAIARELRAYAVGAARTEHKTHPSDTSAAQLALETRVALWGANATLEQAYGPFSFVLNHLEVFDIVLKNGDAGKHPLCVPFIPLTSYRIS